MLQTIKKPGRPIVLSSNLFKRLQICLVVMISTAALIGEGPDYEAMLYYVENYKDHYFGLSNAIVAFIPNILGHPELFQFIVYALLYVILISINLDRWLLYVLLTVFSVIICTGNYRIGLAGIIFCVVTKADRLKWIGMVLAILFHYSASLVFLFQFAEKKSNKRLVLLTLALLTPFLLGGDRINVLLASVSTHVDPLVDTGTENVKVAGLVYAMLFSAFSYLTRSRIFAMGAILAFGAFTFDVPLFTRVLIYFKILVFFPDPHESPKITNLRTLIGLILISITLRNDYYLK